MINRKDALEGLSIFVQVIESGSFSAAATELGHAVSHISKSITKLEERLGARLINRTTRSLSLTDVGQVYYEKARQIVGDAREAEQSIHQLQDTPSGRLKISLPNSFGQSHMQPVIRDYMLRYPEVKLQIDFSSRLVDLTGEGFDLCVRMGQLKSSNLISRKLLDFDFYTVASPDYLASIGSPQHPQELKKHQAIKYMYNQVPITWDFCTPEGETLYVEVENRVECNNLPMLKTLVIAGVGITRLPSYDCINEIKQGKLVRLLADYDMPTQCAYMVYPHRLHLSAKVRAFVDLALNHFK
ncbi:LysR family transcriptional regulator [Thiomicrospira microaerophila]|uniref:LysR family transcriptional regulator n=1 Tax=Thiomicrospira microaerophila TaxID=406020 RepID=UPI00200F6EC2|nr:LysR family transcriptional regulator [Thiomicrospira microaerophila]UQB42203.1 LysR family transcriptional regulator [Thiomicrospira microaerophila]